MSGVGCDTTAGPVWPFVWQLGQHLHGSSPGPQLPLRSLDAEEHGAEGRCRSQGCYRVGCDHLLQECKGLKTYSK